MALAILISLCATKSAKAQKVASAQSAGGFAPGARASASANATLDSVVGNRPSPVKSEVSLGGAVYRVTPQGAVIGPDGHAVSGGCPSPASLASGQFVAGGAPAEPALSGTAGSGTDSKKSESVMIGVTNQRPAGTPEQGADPSLRPAATMNASFGPAGVYVLPNPCRMTGTDKKARIHDAAAALATAGGNAFALAGNRDGVREATEAHTLDNGDIRLSVAQTDKAEPRLEPSNSGHSGGAQ